MCCCTLSHSYFDTAMKLFSTILVIVLFNFANTQFINFSNNPCSEFFHFIQNNGIILGYLEFANDYSGYYELSVNMSISAYVTGQNIRLELRTSASDLVNGRPVIYFIYFPIQEILPKPTRIVFNNKVYCTGPPEDLRPGGTVTNMWATTYFRVSTPSSVTKPGIQYFWQFGEQPTSTFNPLSQPTFPNSPFIPSRPSFPVDLNLQPVYTPERPTPGTLNLQPIVHPTTSTTVPPFTNPPVEDCGYSSLKAQNLVVNGKEIQEGEYPWLVAIMYRQNYDYRYRCTGSLISRRHVITAGHCVRYYQALLFPIEDFLLILGKNDLRNWASDAIIRNAQNITVHPNYQQNKGDSDVAIIHLHKVVELSPNIRPVCIWEEDDLLDKVVGLQGTVVGWGRDETENLFVPSAKAVSIPIVSQVECLRSDPGFSGVTSSKTFCAGRRDGSGPCTGDSGGGFFMNRNGRWRLRGVVSLSLGEASTCDATKYFVFVDAAKLRDWILTTIS